MTRTMSKALAGVALCTGLSSLAQADMVFGVYAGAYAWSSSLDGDFNSDDNTDIDTQDTLALDDDTASSFYVAVEHGVPLIPNVKLRRTELEFTEQAILTSSVVFDGKTFGATSTIDSTIDLSHTDATLYYEILDNVVSADFGLTARVFDGKAKLSTSGQNASIDLNTTIPMAYVAVQVDLPLTGLYVGAEGNFISISGNKLQDASAKIGYTIAGGLGVEAGYRVLRLTLDDVSDLNSDISADGAYAAATFHF